MQPGLIRELFNRHDLRWTRQREEVYAALAASRAHPTAEDLFALVTRGSGGGAGGSARVGAESRHTSGVGTESRHTLEDEGGMSLATVYNTLDALVRCGLARRLAAAAAECGAESTHGRFRYDADVADHAHLIATDGRIHDLPGDLGRRVVEAIPRDVLDQVERELGVRIGRISVELVQSPGAPAMNGRGEG